MFVGVIFSLAHDATLSNCRVPAKLSQMGIAIWDEELDKKRPRLGLGGWSTGAAQPLRYEWGIPRRSATG
jgi:hypothetical protein